MTFTPWIAQDDRLSGCPPTALEKKLREILSDNVGILEALHQITGQIMLDEGHADGGNRHKLEPKELGNVPIIGIIHLD